MRLSDITMKEFEAGLKKTKTLVVPYGTVEAHGTHLPLSTDTFVIEAVLKEVEGRVDAFIAPVIHYGVCTSTGPHPGTVTITPATLRALTTDILDDAYAKGLRNFILISGHGGGMHAAAMKEAAEAVVMKYKAVKAAAVCVYDILPKDARKIAETENDSHAGEIETSLILHLLPKLVKGRSKEEYPAFVKPYIVRDKLRQWPGAVWGNPAKADAKKGKKIFDMMVDASIDLIRGVERLR
ncbi:MAG: creatininase family protein [Deltaproteobacteria bacterium]|nr:creatininase family protein [Deltaproteobacteria bacterium]